MTMQTGTETETIHVFNQMKSVRPHCRQGGNTIGLKKRKKQKKKGGKETRLYSPV
jgi:hypothetical protein